MPGGSLPGRIRDVWARRRCHAGRQGALKLGSEEGGGSPLTGVRPNMGYAPLLEPMRILGDSQVGLSNDTQSEKVSAPSIPFSTFTSGRGEGLRWVLCL